MQQRLSTTTIKKQNYATRDYRILREVTQKENELPCGIIYMWNLKYDTNQLIYETNRIKGIENKLVVAKGKGDGRG